MTTTELHIGIDIGIHRIRTNSNRNVSPYEKDMILNQVRDEYITEKLDIYSNISHLKHQNTKKRITDLEPLIYSSDFFCFGETINSSEYLIPSNYLENINLKVQTSCAKIQNKKLNKFYYCIVELKDLLNLFKDFTLTCTTDTETFELFNLSNYVSYKDGLNEIDEKFYLINLIKDEIFKKYTQRNIEVFWEEFNQQYYSSSFIFYSTTPFNSINVSNGIYNSIQSTIKSVIVEDIDKNAKYVDVRIVEQENLNDILENFYSKTSAFSPVATIQNGKIIVYKDKFELGNLNLTFYKNPRKINFLINQNCEITHKRGQEIVNKAVDKILAYKITEGYQLVKNENLILNKT